MSVRRLMAGLFGATPDSGSVDPNWDNVSLLMHMDGSNGSTVVKDEKGNVVTPVGAAAISTAQSKFGGASLAVTRAADHITIPTSASFNYGAGDFTYEAWVKIGSDSTAAIQALYEDRPASGTGTVFALTYSAGKHYQWMWVSGTSVTPLNNGLQIPTDRFVHLAWTRQGSTVRTFIDGVLNQTSTYGGTLSNWGPTVKPCSSTQHNQPFLGHVDEVRITKGVARYTETFVPPTEAFPNKGAPKVGGLIGTPGAQGFGVGVCPEPSWLTELGLSEMTGTTDPAHENCGNYQHTNGGISVFVPKFYYAIGLAGTPPYAKYGVDAFHIVGIETYGTEAQANAAGYALHRAFIDGGQEKCGFFYDKYLASKDGLTSCKSVKNGHPISLATTAGYEPSSTMTGCSGTLADSLQIARGRGYGWNTVSIFMPDALAKLSLAHGQAATTSDFCAWYDAAGTTSFPKGCNNNALADVTDPSVTFTAAVATKPLSGSASNFAKTTHNGQACGIADVNGAIYQAVVGLTSAGTAATSSTAITTGACYLLKRTSKHADLTPGWNGTTDAWGTAASLATRFDLINGFLPWGSTIGWVSFGNGVNQVFSGEISGTNYLRSCSGVQSGTGAMSAAGIPLFGGDGCYQALSMNSVPRVAGNWSEIGLAGVFCRGWNNVRSSALNYNGFRASAYGTV